MVRGRVEEMWRMLGVERGLGRLWMRFLVVVRSGRGESIGLLVSGERIGEEGEVDILGIRDQWGRELGG
jgi:hypothetical protein